MYEMTSLADGVKAGTWPSRIVHDADGHGLVDADTYQKCLDEQAKLYDLLTGNTVQTWEPPHPMALTVEECEQILEDREEWREPSPDQTFGGEPVPGPIRKPHLARVATPRSLDILNRRVKLANVQLHRKLVMESVQVLDYGPEDQMTWHTDRIPFGAYHRHIEISVIAQLSPPEDYTGGLIQFKDGSGEPISAPKTQGLVMAFPSEREHRVTPVESGRRLSLSGFWFSIDVATLE